MSHCDLQILAVVPDNSHPNWHLGERYTMEGKIRMTWRELNDRLGKTKDGKLVLKFYEAERKGSRRKRWLSRMYHRYSYLRRKKEMKAVASGESFV
jgi:hypothetical protein